MFDTVLDGLCFGEGPRWYAGRLWFSDMHAREVIAVDDAGNRETIVELADDEPSGLGWLPDGSLLIVAMQQRALLRLQEGELTQFADLSGVATWHCNDMVTDELGRSWVGNFGFDLHQGGKPVAANLARVDPDGSVSLAATDLMFPNGTVITPDGRTLIVGESFGGRMTAFDISADGELDNRRVWAELPERAVPDGCCLDAEGAIWTASPTTSEVIRIAEGGEVLERLPTGKGAFACMLGGADQKTLYVLIADDSAPEAARSARSGELVARRVEVPGAGFP